MQYIEYQYAKEKGIVGQVIYNWMKLTPHLDTETRGKVIKQWYNSEILLHNGKISPDSINQKKINEWAKAQIDSKYHQQFYTSAYLKGYFKL